MLYLPYMTITQTVEIPADRRVTLEVPREVPMGETTIIIQFPTKKIPQNKRKMTAEEEKTAINRIAQRLKVEMADVLEMQCCHPEDVGL